MPLEILDPAFLTTVQDLGRVGYQQFGVTRGGAMDTLALRAANRLVGNIDDAAGLEITASGFKLRALEKTIVAVAGAEYELHASERRVPMNTALFLRAGETLAFGARIRGSYAYLAVGGGIAVPRVLGSCATDVRGGFGGLEGRALQAGDVLNRRPEKLGGNSTSERAGKMLSEAFRQYYRAETPIRVIWGPHEEFFDDAARESFIAGVYALLDLSDRMGTRLVGPAIARASRELLSCGVTRGAIQIPPDGQPIILQADHQTTGGYPVLATVIRADLPRLAQKRAQETVTFRAVTLAEVDAAWETVEEMLNELWMNQA